MIGFRSRRNFGIIQNIFGAQPSNLKPKKVEPMEFISRDQELKID
jgi:hypothetical protein